MGLGKYKQKRKFDQTPEPLPEKTLHGKISSSGGKEQNMKSKKLSFVVQKHHASQLHYDFRLELGGVLKSWAVPKGLSLDPHHPRLAMMVEDHPMKYAKFSGIIPEGNYGAGKVEIWDKGTFEPHWKDDYTDAEKLLQKMLRAGHLTIILHGKRLKGEFALVRSPKMGENAWLIIKKGDKYARS